jgi:hypothetical protein
LALAASAFLCACTHIGPATVTADRFDYNTAIGNSWKEQTLLNIVKLRHADIPVFVDVASIVSGYSMETTVNIGGEIFPSTSGDKLAVGGAGRFTDRPTITYVPKTGEKFLRSLLTPIDPKNIFFMLQAGYPADFILGLSVESINGVRNRSASMLAQRDADPEFVQAMQLLREIQLEGGFGMRVESDTAKRQTAILFFRRNDLSPESARKAADIRRLLRLAPDRQKYVIVYSPVPGEEGEIAVNSRSMLQIMTTFASHVEAPDAHELKNATLGESERGGEQDPAGNVQIHSGDAKPADAYVTVKYRNRWYWIDDSDAETKRALAAIMLLFTLTDEVGNESVPLITIPAQ